MEEYLACSQEHSIITHYALLPQEPIMTCLDLFLDQKPSHQTKQAPYGESEAGQDQHHKKLESHQQREDNCLIHLP